MMFRSHTGNPSHGGTAVESQNGLQNSPQVPITVSLTVRDLRVRAVDLPLDTPIQTAIGTVGTSPLVLIDLLTDEDIAGSAYIFCYTPVVLRPLVQLLSNIAVLLRGSTAAPAAISETLEAHFRLLGSAGLVGMASAGIDMAAWDAMGKAEKLPLSTLLGGRVETIQAYRGLRSMQPEAAALEASEAAEAGFGAVKLKLGHPTLDEDLALVRAVRDGVDDGLELMADYNQSLTLPEAVRRGEALDGEGLAWIEEPLRAEEDAGHAQIRRSVRTPIQLGENWWGPRDMERSMRAGAFDYATFDAVRIGGITGWLQAASLAEQSGHPVSSHRYPEVSSSLLAVTPTSQWLEYVDTVSPVLEHPLHVRGGQVEVPSEPGLGLAWNERAVERCRVG